MASGQSPETMMVVGVCVIVGLISAIVALFFFSRALAQYFTTQYDIRVINADMIAKYYGPRAFAKMDLCWPAKYVAN